MEISTMAKETIAAVLYTIVLCATKESSTNQFQKKTPSFYDHKGFGLTSILYSKKGYHGTKRIVHSCTITSSTIAAVVYAIYLWATKASSSSNQSQKKPPSFYDDKSIGLTSLLYSKKGCQGTEKIVHSCTITSSTRSSAQTMTSFSLALLSTSTSWSSSTTGDLLGIESGVLFMSSGEDTILAPWENIGEAKPLFSTQRSSSRVRMSKTNDVPPPNSYLRREGKYKGMHSWYLGREYVDGRLILVDTCGNGNNHFDEAVNCREKVDEGNGCQKVEVDGEFVENKEENGNVSEIFSSSDEDLFKN